MASSLSLYGAAQAGTASEERVGCAFTLDVEHLLRRYAKGVAQVLKPATAEFGSGKTARARSVSWATEVRNTKAQDEAVEAAQEALLLQRREDELTVGRACERYRKALATEHVRWLQAEDASMHAGIATRQQEMEVARRHYTEPGRVRLSVAVQERQAAYATRIIQMQHADPPERPAGLTAEQAQKAYTDNAREWLLKEMRQEWRMGQLKVLQNLARELRVQRRAAAEVLGRHVQAWEQVSEAVKSAWSGELRRAQDRLDQLAKAYTAALRSTLKVELMEVRKHATEQANFFQRELSEALKAEKAEEEVGAAQLRRMRLTLCKWRNDYLRDARRKAEQAADHRWTGLAAALAGDRQVEEEGPHEGEGGDCEEEDNDDRHRYYRKALIAKPHAAAERLRNCRLVLEQIWERLPVSEDEARGFLQRLEGVVPCTGGVIHLYEEHLAEHGVLAALGAAGTASTRVVEAEVESVGSQDGSAKKRYGRPLDASWRPRSGPRRVGEIPKSIAMLRRLSRDAPGPGWR